MLQIFLNFIEELMKNVYEILKTHKYYFRKLINVCVKNKVNEYFVTLKRGNKVVFYKGE
jgi:hypothetical protein